MSDVVKLVASNDSKAAPIVNAEVVDALEKVLRAAKAGEVNGIALAVIGVDQHGAVAMTASVYAGSVRQAVASGIGAVEILKERMVRELMQWG